MRGPEQGRKVKDECQHSTVKESNEAAKTVIINTVQGEGFALEINVLKRNDDKGTES